MVTNRTARKLPPWQDAPVPTSMRLMGYAVILCMFALIIGSVIVLFTAVAEGRFAPGASPGTGYMLLHVVLPIAGILAGIIGWVMVRRYAFGHDDFRVQAQVPPGKLGSPFVIQMSQPIGGWGMLVFAPDGIKIQAEAPRFHSVILWRIIEEFIIYMIALAIRKLLHKQKANYTLDYAQVTGVKVSKRSVVIFSPDAKIKKTKFKVSSADGERLYRELNVHFPAAIEEWRHLLVSWG